MWNIIWMLVRCKCMSQSAGHSGEQIRSGRSDTENNLKKQERAEAENQGERKWVSSGETGACLPELWLQERGAAWEGLIEGRGCHGNKDHRIASAIFHCSLQTGAHCRSLELWAHSLKTCFRLTLFIPRAVVYNSQTPRSVLESGGYRGGKGWGSRGVLWLFFELTLLIIFWLLIAPAMLVFAINILQKQRECQPPAQI